jgi:hypothetical protein
MILILFFFASLLNSKIFFTGNELLEIFKKNDFNESINCLNDISEREDKFSNDAAPYYSYVSNLVKINNCKKGAEVGVYFGGLSEAILSGNLLDKFYLVDSYPLWLFGSELRANLYFFNLVSRMKKFKDQVEIIRQDSEIASTNFLDNSLDFVFIDACHDYESVKLDIKMWYSKVKNGGLFMGDDYNFEGVKKAVNEFASIYNYQVVEGCGRIWSIIK